MQELVCGLRRDRYGEFHVTVLKAFIDDSGSGGDSPWFVLAGLRRICEGMERF